MNTIVTSKEAILHVSRKLIQEKGWTALNIRSVAAACNVSVGSIYNYFPSKADLITETVESIWQDIFRLPEHRGHFDNFVSCVQWAFDCMRKGNETYPGFFTLHSISFLEEDKSSGKRLMAQSWAHIQTMLSMVLQADPQLRPGVFDETFPMEKFVDMIFSLILSALLRQDYDCSAIVEMIHRILY